MPGGIQADPPTPILYGSNLIAAADAGFEPGSTGWSFGTKWTDATDDAHAGTHSAKVDLTLAGTVGTLSRNITTVLGARAYGLRAWVKVSADFNATLRFQFFAHGSIGGTTAQVTPTTVWTQFEFAFLALNSLHDGETLNVRTDLEGTQTLGQLWLDDIEFVQYGLPFQVRVPSRWWGYVWEDESPLVTAQIDLIATGLQDALVDLELKLDVVDQATPTTIYLTQTLSSLTDGGQQATFDFTNVPLSIGTLLKSTLRRKVGGATAKLANGVTDATFPDWKLIRERVSARNSLPSYIDFATGTAVVRGRKRLVWGGYFNGWPVELEGLGIPSINQSNYDSLFYPGFVATDPLLPGWVMMRRHGLNVYHDYVSMQLADPRAGTDQITPGITSMRAHGIAYSQHTREYYRNRGNSPSWFDTHVDTAGPGTISSSGTTVTSSIAHGATKPNLEHVVVTSGAQNGQVRRIIVIPTSTTLTIETAFPADVIAGTTWNRADDSLGWTTFAQRVTGQSGFFGWYAWDEPSTQELTNGLRQYRMIRDNATAGVAWGVGISVGAITDYRFRYGVDVATIDVYPTGGDDPDNRHFQAAGSTPKHANTWAAGRELYLENANGQRPHWLVLQSFVFAAPIPDYAFRLTQVVSGLITGAKGFLWWNYSKASTGIAETMIIAGTTAAHKSTGVSTDGIGTTFSGDFSAILTAGRFEAGNRISTDPNGRRMSFLLNDTIFAVTTLEANWVPNANAEITLEGIALNSTGGRVNILTGAWTVTLVLPPPLVSSRYRTSNSPIPVGPTKSQSHGKFSVRNRCGSKIAKTRG